MQVKIRLSQGTLSQHCMSGSSPRMRRQKSCHAHLCEAASPEQVCADRGKGVKQVMQAALGQVCHMCLWGHAESALLLIQMESRSWVLLTPEHAQSLHIMSLLCNM